MSNASLSPACIFFIRRKSSISCHRLSFVKRLTLYIQFRASNRFKKRKIIVSDCRLQGPSWLADSSLAACRAGRSFGSLWGRMAFRQPVAQNGLSAACGAEWSFGHKKRQKVLSRIFCQMALRYCMQWLFRCACC